MNAAVSISDNLSPETRRALEGIAIALYSAAAGRFKIAVEDHRAYAYTVPPGAPTMPLFDIIPTDEGRWTIAFHVILDGDAHTLEVRAFAEGDSELVATLTEHSTPEESITACENLHNHLRGLGAPFA